MMNKTIISQTGDMVNYANVMAIYTDYNLIENENSEDITIYQLCADTAVSVYVLGEYETEKEAEVARNKLIEWLQSETYGVYSIPEHEENM